MMSRRLGDFTTAIKSFSTEKNKSDLDQFQDYSGVQIVQSSLTVKVQVVYNCFLRKVVRHNDTDVTSFCMQLEKVRRGLLAVAFQSEGECFVG